MASNCNNTTAPTLCQGTTSSNLGCSSGSGCLDIYNTSCIQYDGSNLVCTNIPTGTNLNDILCTINNQLCTLTEQSGLIIVDTGDTNPDVLINKLVAGANIVLTGIGTGTDRQIRIDSVLGGQIVDELVKASATDQTAGFLDSKLTVGPCMFVQKINPGINEKLQVTIDWQCALNQISQLPGFCTLINGCIPNAPTVVCPYILLNNPILTGGTATLTWLSSGTMFNVYIDGVLQSGMPTNSLTYTSSNLANGSHTAEVIALCNSGTPQRDFQTFLINTACPVPNQLAVTLTGGIAGLSWALDSNSNNQSQTIQYKLNSVSNWSTSSSVNPITTTATINGLNQNKLYNFQIINNCSVGGPSPSTPITAVELTCPSINLTPTSTSINYSFVGLGGDVDTYVLILLDSTGITILQSKTESAPFASTITNTFNGLSSSTTYQVQCTVKAAQFSKVCGNQTTTTTNVPVCPTVSNFSVTFS